VVFELLNEPHGRFDGASWNALAARAVREIRRTNPNRWVVVDGVPWADAVGLAALALPADPRIVATFHAYEPKLFTSQGSDWMGPEFQTTGVVFPGPPASPLEPVPEAATASWVVAWFKQYNTLPSETNPCGPSTISRQFHLAEAFAQRASVPVWVGEYAAVDGGDLTSRANYLRAVRMEAERRGMPWTYWDDGGHNKLMDVPSGTVNRVLYDALFSR
jgi:endoglucanase